ncbi:MULTISPECIES: sodium:alanine symporter family protein [unclassified Photobacterium]|uniref:alanine/glycine:cation symporter family protein n=1 Tax=unclassified Photobacterium TaxID=2628852 RepID=UPI000D165E95|nr:MULTISPECIES: sodium:alanine symporter family protein [unclassified Photobacterium]PSV27307.1 sodium:alanine symporter family protein [Photobacterium sp. GB-56]PSV41088.1 sodium:alanine symporter family protein [Photobacterium sp. GB-210]PSV50706.1 sodium:alanine symporter family protein [Photobacterium sp. GB-1]PSV58755.1 sodium:alanine symporter family protein [Photobacterium sp. GB-3]
MNPLHDTIFNFLKAFDSLVWGPPLLILLVGTGLYLTIRLGFIQVRYLPLALRYVFGGKKDADSKGEGDVSSFAALCTALSATIGTGNIVGVATAIKLGGPGALFWMWLAAVLGMATKYAECLLAVKYREVDSNGQILGGPMYYIEKGVGSKWLAKLFALFAVGVACFGIGTFPQANAIVEAAQLSFNIPKEITVVILTVLVATVTLGGIKSISSVASTVVPLMAGFYIIACISVLASNFDAIPNAISLVIESAFTGHAATGGFVGAGIMLAIQSGIARGVFSNESGLGSAPIAAAAAQTDSCVRQGLISMTGTFFDTVIICTMTGLTLIVTGAWSSDFAGAAMTTHAFAEGLHSSYYGPLMVSVGLMFFAFTTILGWNYYGERCITYLFGVKAILPYKLFFLVLIAGGAFMQLDMIWVIADIVNGLMAIPNLIGLVVLRHVVIAETQAFFAKLKQENSQPISAL